MAEPDKEFGVFNDDRWPASLMSDFWQRVFTPVAVENVSGDHPLRMVLFRKTGFDSLATHSGNTVVKVTNPQVTSIPGCKRFALNSNSSSTQIGSALLGELSNELLNASIIR